METLFGGQKEVGLDIPEDVQTVQGLLAHLRDVHVKDHPELFMQGHTMYY